MKYTDSHEWINLESDDTATVGVTQYAQQELGDVVFVELPIVNKSLKQGDEVAVLESTKAAADIYSPVSGTITAVNDALKDQPELVNQSPQANGWIYKIRLSSPEELDLLKDEQAYQMMIKGH